jgi:hypothetical protein
MKSVCYRVCHIQRDVAIVCHMQRDVAEVRHMQHPSAT